VDCTPELTVHLSATKVLQGDLVQVELQSKTALTEISGDWQDRKVFFWRVSPDVSNSPKLGFVWRGLVGIDLETAAAGYELFVRAKGDSGIPVSCRIGITVGQGIFATERLQVQKQFVEPSPEQLERSNRERQKLRAIFDTTSSEKLWQGAFRIPLDGATQGGNFGKRRVLNGCTRHSGGRLFLLKSYFSPATRL
jgi:hypothetical protein